MAILYVVFDKFLSALQLFRLRIEFTHISEKDFSETLFIILVVFILQDVDNNFSAIFCPILLKEWLHQHLEIAIVLSPSSTNYILLAAQSIFRNLIEKNDDFYQRSKRYLIAVNIDYILYKLLATILLVPPIDNSLNIVNMNVHSPIDKNLD